jgi:hypothetical protein
MANRIKRPFEPLRCVFRRANTGEADGILAVAARQCRVCVTDLNGVTQSHDHQLSSQCAADPSVMTLTPMRLLRIPEPFDHPDFIFEPKIDGFRALAYVEGRPNGGSGAASAS